MTEYLTEAERCDAVDLAVNLGTYLMGAWAEGMTGERDTEEGWEHAAAAEAVDLFAPRISALLDLRTSPGGKRGCYDVE